MIPVYQIVKAKNLREGDRLQHPDGEHVVKEVRHDFHIPNQMLLRLEGQEGQIEVAANMRLLVVREL
jgi:hypothetical protein